MLVEVTELPAMVDFAATTTSIGSHLHAVCHFVTNPMAGVKMWAIYAGTSNSVGSITLRGSIAVFLKVHALVVHNH